MLIQKEKHAPREVFSVSQIEKAFGSAHEPDRGCLRAWALKYLAGLGEPQYTYAEALALPDHTPELKKFKGGTIKKCYGSLFHSIAEAYYRGEPLDLGTDAASRFFHGSHLAPHPSQCVEIEIERPVSVRTGPDGDTIAWTGFKDLVARITTPNGPSPRYLVDWKTTTPTVDNRRNRDLGKPPGSWTWQKDAKAIKIDFQANLYAYDEYVNYGALPRGRWVYFANSGKPDARATDYEPELPLVLETVKTLDGHARKLRDQIRSYRNARDKSNGFRAVDFALDVEPNLSNCAAFGGCPYRSAVGGPCTAEQSGVIPVGSLSKTLTRPAVKPRALPAPGPDFSYDTTPYKHDTSQQAHQEKEKHYMGLAEDIANAKAQRAGTSPAPTGFIPNGVPPHVPGYAQNTGAPIPTAGMPSVFPAPTIGGSPATGAAPVFDPAFAFGGATGAGTPPAGPPVAPPAPVKSGHPPYGTATQNPDYVCDGEGGYISKNQIPPAPPPLAPPAPPAQETFPSHVNPPEAANPNLPTEAPKRGRGRPAKAPIAESTAITRDTTPSPPPVDAQDFAGVELTVTLKIGKLVVSVPAPGELADSLQAYVLKQVSG